MLIKSISKTLIAKLGYYVVKKSTLIEIKIDAVSTVKNIVNTTTDKALAHKFLSFLISDSFSEVPLSKSQLGQDFFYSGYFK